MIVKFNSFGKVYTYHADTLHSVESVRIRDCSVPLRIPPKCGKIRTRKSDTDTTDNFHAMLANILPTDIRISNYEQFIYKR